MSERDVRVDWVKAAAILTIPLIHAGPEAWSPRMTATDFLLRHSWTQFAVPAFVMMSGYLYASTRPLSWSTIGRRLVRVIVPYLVVCLVLYATGWVRARDRGGVIADVLTGNTYGIYYYVPVIVVCILASWALSRMPPAALRWLLGGLVGIALAMEHGSPSWPSPFWRFRDPLSGFFLGYFLLGWLGGIDTLALRVPTGVLVLVMVLGIGWNLTVGGPMPLDIRVPFAIAVTALLWCFPVARGLPTVRFLSEASLAIYLLHYPFQVALGPATNAWPPAARVSALWIGSLFATAAFCIAARTTLGRDRARFWLGA